MKSVIVDLLARLAKTTPAKITGAKAREHTRYWNPPGDRPYLPVETKMAPSSIFSAEKWAATLLKDTNPIIARMMTELAGMYYESVIGDVGALNVNPVLGPGNPNFTNSHKPIRDAIKAHSTSIAGFSKTVSTRIRDEIAAGEAAGLSIQEIANRVSTLVDEQGGAWAERVARTETTGAANEASLIAANEVGAISEKQWLTAHDDRVRASHAEMDGESVAMDAAFSNGLMYPGDQDGDADEVINCRCTMIYTVGNAEVDPAAGGGKSMVHGPWIEEKVGHHEAGWRAGPGQSASVHVVGYNALSPHLRSLMDAKLKTMTGMDTEHAMAEMRDNLGRTAEVEWKTHPESANWYHEFNKSGAINAAKFGVTQESYHAMTAATSALKNPIDNVKFVNAALTSLTADPIVSLTQADLTDYNQHAASARSGLTPNLLITPGDYALSELPSYMVPSMGRYADPQFPPAFATRDSVSLVELYRGGSPDEIVSGPKQRSFYNNLVDPTSSANVTIDSWMYRAAIADNPLTRDTKFGTETHTLAAWETDPRFKNDDGSGTGLTAQHFFQGAPSSVKDGYAPGNGLYPVVAQAVIDATAHFNDAHSTSLLPSEFQSLVWSGARRAKP